MEEKRSGNESEASKRIQGEKRGVNDYEDRRKLGKSLPDAEVLKRLNVLGKMVQRGEVSMQERARFLVYRYVMEHLDRSDPPAGFTPDEVYVVWFCKTLQNWKCLVSTTLPDRMYYEITHDGDKNCEYLDVYMKFDNLTLRGNDYEPVDQETIA